MKFLATEKIGAICFALSNQAKFEEKGPGGAEELEYYETKRGAERNYERAKLNRK